MTWISVFRSKISCLTINYFNHNRSKTKYLKGSYSILLFIIYLIPLILLVKKKIQQNIHCLVHDHDLRVVVFFAGFAYKTSMSSMQSFWTYFQYGFKLLHPSKTASLQSLNYIVTDL